MKPSFRKAGSPASHTLAFPALRRATIPMVLLATTALAGCASAEGGGSGDDDEVVVGYSGYTLTNPFFAGLVKGLEDGADAHGYTLITTNSNGVLTLAARVAPSFEK